MLAKWTGLGNCQALALPRLPALSRQLFIARVDNHIRASWANVSTNDMLFKTLIQLWFWKECQKLSCDKAAHPSFFQTLNTP